MQVGLTVPLTFIGLDGGRVELVADRGQFGFEAAWGGGLGNIDQHPFGLPQLPTQAGKGRNRLGEHFQMRRTHQAC